MAMPQLLKKPYGAQTLATAYFGAPKLVGDILPGMFFLLLVWELSMLLLVSAEG
ncbi:hypothetical protein ACKF11_03045 [Methylobacillus sp. Pita2]|uniref:hypothetical protein n=1 Tax=unclassified Methylobacillus TaxID=2647660 RepID=UPI0038B54D41